MEIIPAVIIFKYKLPIPFIRRFVKSMQTHSDFRKFDNMLRMVIDCTLDQTSEIKNLLSSMHKNGGYAMAALELKKQIKDAATGT